MYMKPNHFVVVHLILIQDHKSTIIQLKKIIFYNLQKAMAPYSSTIAWKIPWTEEPGRLQSMGSLGVRHD